MENYTVDFSRRFKCYVFSNQLSGFWRFVEPNCRYDDTTTELKKYDLTNLGNELDDFDEDTERHVSRHDHFGAFREQAVHDALQFALCGRVTFAFDANHVHPIDKRIRNKWGNR